MKPYELQSNIAKAGPSPLYFIVGEEDYLRDQAVACLKAAVLAGDAAGMGDFNLDVLYGDETDASEIMARANEAPAFAPRRLVLVKCAEKLSSRAGEALLPYLKAPCETTTLVFIAPKLDGRMKFAMTLKERAVTVECGPLPEQQVGGWIHAEAGRLGIRVKEDAMLLLRDLAGSASLSLVKRELEKLATYAGASRTVGAVEVEAVRGSEAGASVFDLTAAIGARNRERVLRIVARNLEAGEAPLRSLGSLVWQYRQLWKAKELVKQPRGEWGAGRMVGVPAFKAREFLGRFSESHLKTAFSLFLETDSKLKGGSATAGGLVLEALLLELCVEDKKPGSTTGRPATRPPQSANPATERTGQSQLRGTVRPPARPSMR